MTACSTELHGTALHAGTAEAPVLRLELPLSFWGGVDETGRIVDARHPQRERCVTGRVLAMDSGRGSSSSSSVLAELLRSGYGPAAIVLAERDAIVTLGAIVADELYDIAMPVVVLTSDDFARLADGTDAAVDAGDASATVRIRC